MTKEVRWTRWHRFDNAGTKFIKRFENNEDPSCIFQEGYTAWIHGTGPMTDEQYRNVVNAIRTACQGVPKSEAQREKMRQAKLGIPKSEEHKQNMTLAWERRRENGMGNLSQESRRKMIATKKLPGQTIYHDAMAKLEQMRKQGTI